MEIMLLGAISLLLLIFEDDITRICFDRNLDQSWTMLYRLRGCPCCLQRTKRVTQCFLLERKCGPGACNCESSNPKCLVRALSRYLEPTWEHIELFSVFKLAQTERCARKQVSVFSEPTCSPPTPPGRARKP